MLETQTTALPKWIADAARTCADPRETAKAVAPILDESGPESERLGTIADSAARALAESGLWSLLLSEEVGDKCVDPETYIDVIDTLAYADGSSAWCLLAAGFGTGVVAANVGPAAREAIFNGDAGYICAGHLTRLGRATRVEGGYEIEGDFNFASGSRFASWFLGAFQLFDENGPVVNDKGEQRHIGAVAPRSGVRFQGNWDVMGLAATESLDFHITKQVVSDDFVIPDLATMKRPMFGVNAAVAHAAWQLGAARRVLDEIKSLARHKQRFGRRNLIEQGVFQSDYARNEAAVSAAGLLLRATHQKWFDEGNQGGAALETRAKARIAASWAGEVSVEAAKFAYLASGADGLRNGSTLQRFFRDVFSGSQHALIDHNVLREGGSAILGTVSSDAIGL